MVNIVTTDLIGAGVQITLTAFDVWYIPEARLVSNTGGTSISGNSVSNAKVHVDGTIASGGNGIYLTGTSNNNEVTVGQTGKIYSDEFTGISMIGNFNAVSNAGQITATRSYGISITGDDGSIFNSGTIIASSAHEFYSSAVKMEGDNARLTNTGTLQSSNSSRPTVYFESVLNEITTTINLGSIISSGIAYEAGASTDTLINAGVIAGSVSLGDGADTFDGRGGSVVGSVSGGFGDDTYLVDDASLNLVEAAVGGTDTVQSTVGWTLGDNFENLTLLGASHVDGYGNGESNVITGNQGNNVLNGLGSADTLYGEAGDDKLNGGNGIDNLFGGDGDDRLRGQKGFDVLKAEAGNDSISGGQGDDNLFGGDGNDILKGGMGKDKLYGGDDADVFLFTKAAQSKNDSTADSIKDFELGLDTIDLAGVAAGTLTFIGASAFSGTQGEVQVTGASNSTVLVDVDGDGSADMKITVTGVTGLAEGDFVL